MNDLFILLGLFQVKHFLSDYPLQTQWMLGKSKAKGWVLPLLAHAGVHAAFTAAIVTYATWDVKGGLIFQILAPIFDFVVHFTMDRIKASPNMLGRFKPDRPYFWWSLGLDQAVHHSTHYIIIWALVS